MTQIPSTGPAGQPGSQDPAGMAGGVLRSLPKISLHDHLDGGVRPQTLLELSAAAGHEAPADSAEGIVEWMRSSADSGSLERYLQTFGHLVAVLQDADSLRRVAREAVEDLAADGVIHSELRWAPEQHLAGGLGLSEAVEAVEQGLRDGIAAAAQQGLEISAGQLLCAMRQEQRSLEIAQLVIERFAPGEPGGVLGFDLAGPEDGFPPSGHQEALDLLARHLIPVTLHAGEAAGADSLRSAVVDGRALRLGHGVRIVEDIELSDAPDDDVSIVLGELARWVRDRGIALEVCPRSNGQTGAAVPWSPPENLVRVLGPGTVRHPVGFLHRAGFRVVLGPDNRLVSGTDITTELGDLIALHGFTLDDVETLQRSGAQSAFLPLDLRVALEARIGAEFDAVRQSGFPLGLGDLMAGVEGDGPAVSGPQDQSPPQEAHAGGAKGLPESTGQRFERLTAVMDRLRSPGGCAWDARQSHESLLKHLIEESYEVVEAVEAPGGPQEHRDELVEELGDVLLQVVFHSRVAQERGPAQGGFGIDDVLEAVTAKLIRRHPQVFAAHEQARDRDLTGAAGGGEPSAEAAETELHTRWEELKRAEKPQRTGPFDGVPPGLPALQRAEKLLSKARRHGLEPPAPESEGDGPVDPGPGPRTQEELGTALFELVRQASAEGLDAERALREHSADWARQREAQAPRDRA